MDSAGLKSVVFQSQISLGQIFESKKRRLDGILSSLTRSKAKFQRSWVSIPREGSEKMDPCHVSRWGPRGRSEVVSRQDSELLFAKVAEASTCLRINLQCVKAAWETSGRPAGFALHDMRLETVLDSSVTWVHRIRAVFSGFLTCFAYNRWLQNIGLRRLSVWSLWGSRGGVVGGMWFTHVEETIVWLADR